MADEKTLPLEPGDIKGEIPSFAPGLMQKSKILPLDIKDVKISLDQIQKTREQQGFHDPSTFQEGVKLASYGVPVAAAALSGGMSIPAQGAMMGVGGLVSALMNRYGSNKTTPMSPKEQLMELGSNAAMGAAGSALGAGAGVLARAIRNKAAEPIVRTLFKIHNPAQLEMTQAASEILPQLSVGQSTGSDLAKGAERLFAGGAKKELEAGQQTALRDIASKTGSQLRENVAPLTSQEAGAAGQKVVAGRMEQAKKIRQGLYNKFESQHVAQNSVDIPQITGYQQGPPVLDAAGNNISKPIPITQNITIKGAVGTPSATQFAAEIKPQIDALTSGEEFKSLLPYQQSGLLKAKQAINKLTSGVKTLGPDGKEVNLPIMEWAAAKGIKSDINSGIGAKVLPDREQAILGKIATALDEDVKSSVAHWGPQASAALEKANAANAYEKKTFNDEIVNKVFKGGNKFDPEDPSQFFSKAFESPETTERLKAALGQKNFNLIKGHYFDNELMPKIFDSKTGNFNSNALLDELNNPNSTIHNVYNAEERSGLKKFALAARTVAPDTSKAGLWTVAVRGGLALMRLGGAVAGISSHNVGFPAAEVGLEIGMHDFAKNILLNPRYAAIAARLTKVPPNSAEANAGMKMLLKTLGSAGAVATLKTAEGDKQVQITEAGKIVPLDQ